MTVGKQILLQTHGDEYRGCLARAATESEELFLLEDEVLGFDHALVGALALREWKLGPELVHVVLNHHEAQLTTEQGKMIAVVQLAHEICHEIGYGNAQEAVVRLEGKARDRLRLDDETVDAVTSELAESVESLGHDHPVGGGLIHVGAEVRPGGRALPQQEGEHPLPAVPPVEARVPNASPPREGSGDEGTDRRPWDALAGAPGGQRAPTGP